MNFDDLKDRLSSDARATWDRIQENPAFNQLRDRYDNMSPVMQKLTMFGGIAALTFFLLSMPYGYFSTSQDYVSEFEGKRMTIRELLKVSRESADVPQIPQAPPLESIRQTVEGSIRMANLLPEQIKGTEVVDADSKTIPKNLSEGALRISLAKLNLQQTLDLGYQFQSISASVKLKDLMITANREDARYFDVVYKLVALAVPSAPEPTPEPPRERNRNRNNNGEEE